MFAKYPALLYIFLRKQSFLIAAKIRKRAKKALGNIRKADAEGTSLKTPRRVGVG